MLTADDTGKLYVSGLGLDINMVQESENISREDDQASITKAEVADNK